MWPWFPYDPFWSYDTLWACEAPFSGKADWKWRRSLIAWHSLKTCSRDGSYDDQTKKAHIHYTESSVYSILWLSQDDVVVFGAIHSTLNKAESCIVYLGGQSFL